MHSSNVFAKEFISREFWGAGGAVRITRRQFQMDVCFPFAVYPSPPEQMLPSALTYRAPGQLGCL